MGKFLVLLQLDLLLISMGYLNRNRGGVDWGRAEEKWGEGMGGEEGGETAVWI